ncbi:MAG: hypothetical protein KAW49_08435, partial [Anaerolineae bacterium]|nr:hypothetical protein [Anaerolineae bacterium]
NDGGCVTDWTLVTYLVVTTLVVQSGARATEVATTIPWLTNHHVEGMSCFWSAGVSPLVAA